MYTAIIRLGGQNISFNLAFVRRFVVLQFTAIKLLYSVVNVYFHQEELWDHYKETVFGVKGPRQNSTTKINDTEILHYIILQRELVRLESTPGFQNEQHGRFGANSRCFNFYTKRENELQRT